MLGDRRHSHLTVLQLSTELSFATYTHKMLSADTRQMRLRDPNMLCTCGRGLWARSLRVVQAKDCQCRLWRDVLSRGYGWSRFLGHINTIAWRPQEWKSNHACMPHGMNRNMIAPAAPGPARLQLSLNCLCSICASLYQLKWG